MMQAVREGLAGVARAAPLAAEVKAGADHRWRARRRPAGQTVRDGVHEFRRGGRVRRALALALLPLALAACGEVRSGGRGTAPIAAPTRPDCPTAVALADAADLRRYRTPDSQDLTDLIVAARITGLSGQCVFADRRRSVEVTLTLAMEATRGPAARERTVSIPYFVAVTDPQDRILDKAVYSIAAEFPANRSRLRLTGEQVTLTLPITAERPPASYTVVVGFQLTEAELALNRRIAGR